jgi:hypothetical protein
VSLLEVLRGRSLTSRELKVNTTDPRNSIFEILGTIAYS